MVTNCDESSDILISLVVSSHQTVISCFVKNIPVSFLIVFYCACYFPPLSRIEKLIIPFGLVSRAVYFSFPKNSICRTFPWTQTRSYSSRRAAARPCRTQRIRVLSPSVSFAFVFHLFCYFYKYFFFSRSLHLLFLLFLFIFSSSFSNSFNLPCLSLFFLLYFLFLLLSLHICSSTSNLFFYSFFPCPPF
jgi:hypothetical protein